MSDPATNILVQTAVAFLQRYPPFAQMSPQRVAAVATWLKLAYYPMQATLLDPSHGPGSTFFIIQRGRVESRRSQSDELFAPSVHALGVGECFPMSAMLGRRATRNTYRALEDTFCYTLTAAEFLSLFEEDAVFRAFCTNHLSMLLTQAEQVRQGEYAQLVTAQQSLSAPLTALLKREPIACLPSTALEIVLEQMASLNIGAIVIVNEAQEPIGIFTERDVLRRVVLARADLHAPIAAFMTPYPVRLPSEAPAYEAALAMATHAIRHIPVVANNALVGVVSERDLFAIQRHGLHHVSRAIAMATNLASLQQAAADVRQLTLRMLAQGVAAEQLTHLISTLNDRLTQRILALQRATYDLGDIAWCWIALGSEGRSEQTLSTDQDNALIFLPAPHTAVAVTREHLLPFAQSVNNALAQCGFPLCQGNIMAGNADWCLSLDEWQARCTAWVHNPVPTALLNAAIFFDFRALDGAVYLAETLRQSVSDLVRARPAFLWQMARNALEVKPPLGLIRDFVTDDAQDAPGTIDLKAGGIRLFVDGARILALAHDIRATNTADRLRAVGACAGLPANEMAAYINAFYFLQMLRLQHQQANTASPAPNRIVPDTLNDLERRILKEALRQARRLQTRLTLDYPV